MCVCRRPKLIKMLVKLATKVSSKARLVSFIFALLAINTTDMAEDALQGDFPFTSLAPMCSHTALKMSHRSCCHMWHTQCAAAWPFPLPVCCCIDALPFPLCLSLSLFYFSCSYTLPHFFCFLSPSLFVSFDCSITCGLLLLSSFMDATD